MNDGTRDKLAAARMTEEEILPGFIVRLVFGKFSCCLVMAMPTCNELMTFSTYFQHPVLKT